MIIKFLENISENKNKINMKEYMLSSLDFNYLDLISFIPYVFTNLKDINEFTLATLKAFNLEKEKISDLRMLVIYVYFLKEDIDEHFIIQYLIEKFSLNSDFDFLNLKKRALKIVDDSEKRSYFLEKREEEKIQVLDFMKYKEFFSKKEIVKWIATNNRKTKEFYADYGLETNELIKFIKSDLIMDYEYQKTIKILKVNSFEQALENPNILLVKAILSSIILRERFGIGTLSRAIKDGIVITCLDYIEKYYSN